MKKLRRGQRHGLPDLWTESGGEDRIVTELSAFENITRKICWNSPIWEMLTGKIFKDKSLKRKKWLYTVWHSDRKFIRTRVLLRQKERNKCTSQNYENDKCDTTEHKQVVITECDSGEKATEEKNEDEETRHTESEINERLEEKEQEDEEKRDTASKIKDRLEKEQEDEEKTHTEPEIKERLEKKEQYKTEAVQEETHVDPSIEKNTNNDGDSMAVSKEVEKTLEIEEGINKTHEDTMVMTEASGDEMSACIQTDSILFLDDTLFCICRQPNNPNEPYAQCSLCKDWFHPVCVGFQSVQDIAVISPWHCPSCTTDTQTSESGDKDQVKRRLSFGKELPSCPQEFSVSLTRTEWAAIQPADRVGHRILKKGWADVMGHKIASVNKFCVLSFKTNKIKCSQSRKTKNVFWRGKAVCKFSGCTTYFLSIEEDPNVTEGDIPVNVKVQGKIKHSCHEQHSRHCRQPERNTLKGQLGECSPMMVHTKQLASTNEDKLLAGNLNDVKSVPVLQKISSEKNLENRLDRDAFMECFQIQQKQDVEKPSSKIKHSAIQYVAMSPFVVHTYSESQLQILHEQQKKNNCLLYLDATGSVVAKPHPSSQSVLYYALCTPCQSTTKTVLPVAEMLTSDQSTATILHWLTCLRRDYYKLFMKHLKPQKIETDFSWAMIHAVVQAFNMVSIQEYLQLCFQVCQEQHTVQMTVIHLCAAHMLKLISMKLSKVQCKKETKFFFLYCFALLQNATDFCVILSIVKSVVFVLSSRTETKACQEHLSLLQEAIQTQKTDKIDIKNEDDDDDDDDDDGEPRISEDQHKSIRKSSPFFAPIETVVREAKQEARKEDETEGATQKNTSFCESVVEILLDYAGTVPLWSGVMLKHLGKTRDSNAIVENWFRTTKTVVLASKLHRRAGDFLQLQHEFVVGRMKGTLVNKQVPLTKQPSSNEDGKKIDGPDSLPLSQEEKWKKRSTRKRKSKYFNSPPPVSHFVAKPATEASKKSHIKGATTHPPPPPKKGCCPFWGGEGTIKQQTVSMTNTCTVDNLLYMLHLAIKRRPGIKGDLNANAKLSDWISTLLEVHELFDKKEWSQGKLLWLNTIGRFKGTSWDAYGTEEDMVAYRLDFLMTTEILQQCKNAACPVMRRRVNCVDILCEDFSTLQTDIDRWMTASLTASCKRGPIPCTESEQALQRVFVNGQPCLLLVSVIHKNKLSHKLHPTTLPHLVTILGGKYEPAAVTYHLGRKNHFVAFHKLGTEKGWHFFDALEELLNPGKGDVVINDTFMRKKLQAKCNVSHIVMVRDKAAEAVEARRQKNEELVTFIVDHNGADEKLKAILSSDEKPHFSFKDRWVPIIFDDDMQLDRIVRYLSAFLGSCDTLSPEVCTMVSSDRIKYILNVMLSEATVKALQEVRKLTMTEAVGAVEHGQMEESEREELFMSLRNEMERRGIV